MAKITPLNDLTSLANEASVVSTINTNNQRIEDALDNTLSLDGSVPNALTADLDMNSNRITNLPLAVNPSEPITVQQAEDNYNLTLTAAAEATAAAASAAAASTSETNAASSAATATTQAGISTTQATNSSASAAASSASEAAAATSAGTASTQATNAATSAGVASTHATNAATSATDADASATASADSAAAALASEAAASASATAADTSATDASDSADAALAAQQASGSLYAYQTYAAADADKGTRALNSFIQVLVDETRSNARTAYQITTGPVLTFSRTLTSSGFEDFTYLPTDPADANKRLAVELGLIPQAKPSLALNLGDDAAVHSLAGRAEDLTDMLTYTGVPSRTYFNAAGKLVGADFSAGAWTNTTTPLNNTIAVLTIGDVLQQTLDADANNHRGLYVGQLIRSADEGNGANYWQGTVVSYSAVTQVFTAAVTAFAGGGNAVLSRVSDMEVRDATYDPVTGERRGLLVENVATNSILYSSDLSNGNWTKNECTVTANAGRSLSGDAQADKVVPSVVSTAEHWVRQSLYNVGANYITFRAEAAGYDYISVRDGSASTRIFVDLTDGTVSTAAQGGGVITSATATALPGGGYLVKALVTPTNNQFRIYVHNVGGTSPPAFAGDGTSGVLISDVNIHQGATAESSPIPTRTVATTRAGEGSNRITGDTFYKTDIHEGGTILLDFYREANTGALTPVFNLERIGFENADHVAINTESAGGVRYQTKSSNVTQAGVTIVGAAIGSPTRYRIALSFQTNSVRFAANGVGTTEDTVATLPVGLTQANINRNSVTSFQNNYVRTQFKYIGWMKGPVTDDELIAWTGAL